MMASSLWRRCQAIAEYYGPRLPLDYLQHGAFALEVPGSNHFIDGNGENRRAIENALDDIGVPIERK